MHPAQQQRLQSGIKCRARNQMGGYKEQPPLWHGSKHLRNHLFVRLSGQRDVDIFLYAWNLIGTALLVLVSAFAQCG